MKIIRVLLRREDMENTLRIPEALPVLPVKQTVAYPSLIAQLEVDREYTTRLFEDVIMSDRLLVVVTQKDAERKPTGLDDLFRVGTVVRIPLMQQTIEEDSQMVVLGLERVMIGELTREQPYFVARIALKADIEEAPAEMEAAIHRELPALQRLIALSQKMPGDTVYFHFEGKAPREIAYTMAFFAGMDFEHAQRLLELDSVSARIQSLSEYVKDQLAQFERYQEAAYKSGQKQDGSQQSVIEKSLDALNAANSWEETCRALEEQQQVLLSEEALTILRSRIATLRQQKVAHHWRFRLQRDLELLEDVHRQGMEVARQRLEQRRTLWQNQQETLAAFTAMARISAPEDFLDLLANQGGAGLFSPAALNVMQTLGQQLAEQNPIRGEQFANLLQFLEESDQYGAQAAMEKLAERTGSDFRSKYEEAEDILGEYLTSETLEEAYQSLQEHQEILLSDLVHDMLEHYITQSRKAGEHRSAEKLEMHQYLFEDARTRGIDEAWQAFLEGGDEDEEDVE
jgi:Lon protease-like protein